MLSTIYLPIKKIWFDKIRAKEKTEEYRELTEFYLRRFYYVPKETNVKEVLLKAKNGGGIDLKPKVFTQTELRNGYGLKVPSITIELLGITIGPGRTNWGAKEGVRYFVLSVGELLNEKNIKQ